MKRLSGPNGGWNSIIRINQKKRSSFLLLYDLQFILAGERGKFGVRFLLVPDSYG